MANYFRITAYNPAEDICVIMDSNGLFEQIWQFSSLLVKHGFDIIEVSKENKLLDGNFERIQEIPDKIILRACGKGQPQYTTYKLAGVIYTAIQVRNKIYIPHRTKTQ